MAQTVGSLAFLVGVIIAILAGVAAAAAVGYPGVEYIPLLLVILGLVVGVLNITDKEITDFLIAAIAVGLLATTAGGLENIPMLGAYLKAIVQNVAVFVAPAALIVALKAVYNLSKEPTAV